MDKTTSLRTVTYANNLEESESKYKEWKEKDPFPDIEPALLNSADIADYVRITGMIFPFDEDKLKPASYEMLLGGEVLYWGADGNKVSIENLADGDEIIFYKNSITYVTVKAIFKLPDYIALRFNLQIQHVHRGLLLGTGPLINPGFHGKLMIPIHNLTNNNYSIKAGDDLIGVEFTKLSNSEKWSGSYEKSINRIGAYKSNQGKKNDKKFEDYIKTSLPLGIASVLSSLHEFNQTILENQKTIEKLRQDYEKQLAEAENGRRELIKHSEDIKSKSDNLIKMFTFGGVAGAVILILTTAAFWRDMHEYVTGTNTEYQKTFSKQLDEKVYDDIRKKLVGELSTAEVKIDNKLFSLENSLLVGEEKNNEKIAIIERELSLLQVEIAKIKQNASR